MDNKVIDLTGLDTFKEKMDASVDEKIQNEADNLKIPVLASDPENPADGQIWIKST